MVKIEPPLPGMKVVPEFCGTPGWYVVTGSAWASLCAQVLALESERSRFEKETGMNLAALANRSPIERMIDEATNHGDEVMAAWCDWVTTNFWGVAP